MIVRNQGVNLADLINPVGQSGISHLQKASGSVSSAVESKESTGDSLHKLEARVLETGNEIESLQEGISLNQFLGSRIEDVKGLLTELNQLLDRQQENASVSQNQLSEISQQIRHAAENASFNGKAVTIPGLELAAELSDGVISKDRVDAVFISLEQSFSDLNEQTADLESQIAKKSVAFENAIAAFSGSGGTNDLDISGLKTSDLNADNLSGTGQIFNFDQNRISAILKLF
ncbi:MAG: hypothetical protein PHQ23_02550 [Candidatus Wallbacteria bacterium]|nr:hypothetical protein [Candidatus Wallbacteria bacterium]